MPPDLDGDRVGLVHDEAAPIIAAWAEHFQPVQSPIGLGLRPRCIPVHRARRPVLSTRTAAAGATGPALCHAVGQCADRVLESEPFLRAALGVEPDDQPLGQHLRARRGVVRCEHDIQVLSVVEQRNRVPGLLAEGRQWLPLRVEPVDRHVAIPPGAGDEADCGTRRTEKDNRDKDQNRQGDESQGDRRSERSAQGVPNRGQQGRPGPRFQPAARHEENHAKAMPARACGNQPDPGHEETAEPGSGGHCPRRAGHWSPWAAVEWSLPSVEAVIVTTLKVRSHAQADDVRRCGVPHRMAGGGLRGRFAGRTGKSQRVDGHQRGGRGPRTRRREGGSLPLAYAINVAFMQEITLPRSPSAYLQSPTWSLTSLGMAGADRFAKLARERVQELVGQFVTAYLSVNPKP